MEEGGRLTDQGKGEEVADGRVSLRPDIYVFRGGQARLLRVRGTRRRRELAHQGIRGSDRLAEGLKEDLGLVDVPHQDVDAELPEHGDVELDVDGVGVEVAGDLGGGQEAAGFGLAHDPSLLLHHVDGILAILGADAGYEAYVGLEVLGQCGRVAAGDLVRVLVVEVDQVEGDLPPLLLVGLQQHLPRQAPGREIELPADVPGIVHRSVHALGGLGRVRMARVACQEGAQVGVAEAVRDSLSDLVSSEPFDVPPADIEGGHDVLGALHHELLAEGVPVALAGRLEFDVKSRHVSLPRDDQDGAVFLRVD